jgi:hypothetical protein
MADKRQLEDQLAHVINSTDIDIIVLEEIVERIGGIEKTRRALAALDELQTEAA